MPTKACKLLNSVSKECHHSSCDITKKVCNIKKRYYKKNRRCEIAVPYHQFRTSAPRPG